MITTVSAIFGIMSAPESLSLGISSNLLLEETPGRFDYSRAVFSCPDRRRQKTPNAKGIGWDALLDGLICKTVGNSTPSAYAQKFSGKYEHRTITGGIGHNLPQEAPAAFAQAIVDIGAG